MHKDDLIAMSKYRLEQAEEDLASAKFCLEKNYLRLAANRSYYAVFHAIQSITILDNYDSKKHTVILSYFNQHYIKSGIFDTKYYVYAYRAKESRNESDYGMFYIPQKEEVKNHIYDAELFLETVKVFLKNKLNSTIKLKVCGMRAEQNIIDLLALKPDFMGFIFYDKSARNVGDLLNQELLASFSANTKKVGVFVDATFAFIKDKKEKYGLDYIQLHGHESPDFCHQLSALNYNLIKAFSVNEDFDFSLLTNYEPYCTYFLFDTKGRHPGGNGEKFDWNILESNAIHKPFFLSGGIELEDVSAVLNLKSKISNLYALDVNSKFEISAGLKNVSKIQKLMELI